MTPINVLIVLGLQTATASTPNDSQSSPTEVIDAPQTGAMHISARLTINVQQPEERIDEMIALAQSKGGYYSSCSARDVHFKIPPKEVDAFLAELKETGVLSEFDYSTRAIETDLDNTRARIQAREGMITQYMTVLKTARLEAIVMVEREVLNLISQIENLKGRLRKLEHQAEYADINVSLRFRDRRAPINNGSSPFEWINRLNFDELIDSAQYDPIGRPKPSPYALPDGFSAFKKGYTNLAATADGLLYQSYSVKNKPEADIDFWAGAIETRMADAGYHPYTADGSHDGERVGNAFIFQYSAPLGVDDYAYWIKIEPVGTKIWITEITGEIGLFSSHEENISKALEQ